MSFLLLYLLPLSLPFFLPLYLHPLSFPFVAPLHHPQSQSLLWCHRVSGEWDGTHPFFNKNLLQILSKHLEGIYNHPVYTTSRQLFSHSSLIGQILAWSPVTFVGEFLQLLPAFVTKSSASEVLHSLLDLPCLSATLQAHYLTTTIPNITDLNVLPQVLNVHKNQSI